MLQRRGLVDDLVLRGAAARQPAALQFNLRRRVQSVGNCTRGVHERRLELCDELSRHAIPLVLACRLPQQGERVAQQSNQV